MNKTLVLHIGHYKTGTTALQVFCDRNDRALARMGLAYARTRRHFSKHSAFAYTLLKAAGARTLLHGFASPQKPRTLWAPLLAEVRASDIPVLVSSEEFMRFGAWPAAAERLAAMLADAPDIEVRAIAYLRPIQSHLRSWHNQLIKMGICEAGFTEAVCARIEPVHYDYALALRPWIEVLGPERLTICAYDDGLRKGSRVYRHFLSALGTGMPAWPSVPRNDPNPRLDDRRLDAARVANAVRRPPSQAPAWDVASAEPEFARIRAQAEAGLREVAGWAGPGFPLERFLESLPERPGPAEAAREALVDGLIRDRAALEGATEADLAARIAALKGGLPRAADG